MEKFPFFFSSVIPASGKKEGQGREIVYVRFMLGFRKLSEGDVLNVCWFPLGQIHIFHQMMFPDQKPVHCLLRLFDFLLITP